MVKWHASFCNGDSTREISILISVVQEYPVANFTFTMPMIMNRMAVSWMWTTPPPMVLKPSLYIAW